jgi:isopentenyl-diphosphate delta-isomerase
MTTTATTAQAPTTTEDVELTTAQGYDDEQIRLMEEVCIVIDENDQPLRTGTKKECTAPSKTRRLTLRRPFDEEYR